MGKNGVNVKSSQGVGSFMIQNGWTARVETLLEYYQIPYQKTFVKLSEVRKPFYHSFLCLS
ncbi:conserved hypothetical protein [Histoplasma capsulatum H143]|uniref:Uncharacterized protein n=1 Tax=Ajellomyces capsulatus (strain H143) TaxID=544712 RepID=C6HC52_AJECH|nr:conserved hypothetical protein [Histoplasma capsulatum H143]